MLTTSEAGFKPRWRPCPSAPMVWSWESGHALARRRAGVGRTVPRSSVPDRPPNSATPTRSSRASSPRTAHLAHRLHCGRLSAPTGIHMSSFGSAMSLNSLTS